MGNSVYAHLVYGFPVMDNAGEGLAEQYPPKWLLKDPEDDDSGILGIDDIAVRLENIQPPQ